MRAHETCQFSHTDPIFRLWTKTLGTVGTQWTMGYDASEQLETVEASTGGVSNALEFYQYDDAGNRISEQRGGTVRKWGKNELNQLTQYQLGGAMELRGSAGVKSNVTVRELDANDNPVGQPVAATPLGGATNWKARVNVGVGMNKFKVDAVQAEVPQGQVAQSTTRTLGVPLGSVGSGDGVVTPIQYDADGNMTSDGIRSFEWDAENRLVRVAGVAFGEVTFAYDPYHRRTRLTEKFGSQVVAERTLRWAGLELIGERIATNGGISTEDRYYYGNGETRKPTGGATQSLLYTKDHLGSIREVVNASTGAVLARYDYSPYGIRTKLAGGLDADFGYTGHYTNARSGLVLAPYRAYSPELGRWISRDPIEEAGGINLYGYVGNRPLGAVDPLGLEEGDVTTVFGGQTITASRGKIAYHGTEYYYYYITSITALNSVSPGTPLKMEGSTRSECVFLPKYMTALHSVGGTSEWIAGPRVTDFALYGIPPGAAIATFYKGRYQSNRTGNHAAICESVQLYKEGLGINTLNIWGVQGFRRWTFIVDKSALDYRGQDTPPSRTDTTNGAHYRLILIPIK